MQPASAPRLVRLQNLGLLPHITNKQAHELILDALYTEEGELRETRGTSSVAQAVSMLGVGES